MHVAKVNVVCPKCGKATKVGYSEEKGEKVRENRNISIVRGTDLFSLRK